MKNRKQINKQFYNYWKKASIEWRPIYLIVKRYFHIIDELSKRKECGIHQIVLKILESKLLNVIEKRQFEELLEIKLSDKEYIGLLVISGYTCQPKIKSYYISEERIKEIMNVCDATNLYSMTDNTIEGKINEKLMCHYQSKKEKYDRKYMKVAIKQRENAFWVEPANGERFQFLNHVIGKLSIVIMIILFSALVIYTGTLNLGSPKVVDKNKLSFWNSLLGACIPGIITILTTHFLVQHEYKVDYHRERMSSMPVFSLVHVFDKNQYIKENGMWDDKNYPYELLVNTAENDMLIDEDVDLYILHNRGNGMAFNVSHDRGDQLFNFGDILQNGERVLAIRKMSKLFYVISYMDIYGNKYTQRFDMDSSNGRYEITTYPPELAFRTKLVRYQQ